MERTLNPPIRKKKIGRNEPCPCGSGKKYKLCCMNKPKEPIDEIETPEERSRWLERYPVTVGERNREEYIWMIIMTGKVLRQIKSCILA